MKKKIERIIQKYLAGNLTDKELARLMELFSDEEIKEQIEKSIELDYLLSMHYVKDNSKEAYIKFLSRIRLERGNLKTKRRRYTVLSYAALLVLFLGVTYYFSIYDQQGNNVPVELPKLVIDDEAIILKLEDGSIKVLGGDNPVVDKQGQVIALQKANTIIYDEKPDLEKLVYNELYVPYGKMQQLQLSDGTIVYLNSGSSLKYPVKFLKDLNRQVYITGEAYFKVSEDMSHPFIVTTDKVNVRVLGTEFNVSSYKEDEYINTVLVSGKVHLYTEAETYNSTEALSLSPGKMALWDRTGK